VHGFRGSAGASPYRLQYTRRIETMTLQEATKHVVQGNDLSRSQAEEVMGHLMSGEAPAALIAAFLTALHIKGESVDEITGMASTMRALATPIPTNRRPLVDTCGTGGDGAGTFNISTTAAFVVAGAGVAVAKHGNRSAISQCGSADVLEALGVDINAAPEAVGKCVDEIGIGFLFARALHGAMKHVAPVRAELGFRTVFNILGPLTNPAQADGQVMGVFDRNRIEDIAHVLQGLGSRHAFIVAGGDGLDELTLDGVSYVAEAKDGTVRCYEVQPGDFGLSNASAKDIVGGDAPTNAQILRKVLCGKSGPHRDIVLLNAAPAIVAGQVAEDLREGVQVAAEAIDSGEALDKLNALIVQ
jgi:anthranilate phosphoribosyltransferase